MEIKNEEKGIFVTGGFDIIHGGQEVIWM